MVHPFGLFQASYANGIIADEYLKDAKTPEEIRDGFTEIMGDLLMTLPVVSVAGYHSGQSGQGTERASPPSCFLDITFITNTALLALITSFPIKGQFY